MRGGFTGNSIEKMRPVVPHGIDLCAHRPKPQHGVGGWLHQRQCIFIGTIEPCWPGLRSRITGILSRRKDIVAFAAVVMVAKVRMISPSGPL